ncbi:MAG: hypothetical protein ACT4NV_11000 [Rhodoferax sp.]
MTTKALLMMATVLGTAVLACALYALLDGCLWLWQRRGTLRH